MGSNKRHKIVIHLIQVKAGLRLIRALAFVEEENKNRIKQTLGCIEIYF